MGSPTSCEWKHRARVYKFGVLWFWKCRYANYCAGGRARTWPEALRAARDHTLKGGCYIMNDYGYLVRQWP